jgi:hypothetical protein
MSFVYLPTGKTLLFIITLQVLFVIVDLADVTSFHFLQVCRTEGEWFGQSKLYFAHKKSIGRNRC